MFATEVPAVVLQFHSIEPAWVTGENTSVLPPILVLAFLAVLLKCATILPVEPTPTETTYEPWIEAGSARP